MKKNVILIFAIMVFAWASLVDNAYAFACFGTSAMTCNPWQASLERDAYFQTGGRAKHKGSTTGLIQVFCPVFNTTGTNGFSSDSENTWNDFSLTYKDPDADGNKYRVTAALRYLDTSGLVRTIASLDSNQQIPGSTTDTTMVTFIRNHNFNFLDRHYYIQIGINRSDTQAAPDVAGFNICGRIF